MYGTPESALTSLPKNVLQAVASTLIAVLALYAARLEKIRPKTQLVLKGKPVSQPKTDVVSDEETSDEKTENEDEKWLRILRSDIALRQWYARDACVKLCLRRSEIAALPQPRNI